MHYYSLPALIALTLKLYYLFLLFSNKTKIPHAVGALIVFLCLLNLMELLLFMGVGTQLFLFKLYYVFAIISLILISETIFLYTKVKLKYFAVVHLIGLFIIPVVLISDLIIKDVIYIGVTITRIPGDYYFVFLGFTLIQLVCGLYLILNRVYSKSFKSYNRAQCSIILASILPILIVVLGVLFLKALGFDVNLAGILPILTTLFLIGCYKVSTNGSVYDCSVHFPWSPSRRNKEKFFYLFRESTDKSKLWNLLDEAENLYIKEALKDNNGNITKASKDLGISYQKVWYYINQKSK